VLDIGCSSGKLGQELKKNKHCIVYGSEIDEGDYHRAQKVLDKVFLFNIETDILPKTLEGKKFDVIIFADVIEHLVRPVRTLKIAKDLLKPQGRVVFSIPNMAHISVRLQLLSGRFSYNETGLLDKTHLHFYDYSEVQRVMAEAGLQMVVNDSNVLNYPPSFLKEKLAELGLIDNGFTERAQHDINAQVFQFVGYCELLKPDQKVTKIPLSTTTPEQELTDYIEKMHADIKSINITNKRLENYIKILETEKTNIDRKVEELERTMNLSPGKRLKSVLKRKRP